MAHLPLGIIFNCQRTLNAGWRDPVFRRKTGYRETEKELSGGGFAVLADVLADAEAGFGVFLENLPIVCLFFPGVALDFETELLTDEAVGGAVLGGSGAASFGFCSSGRLRVGAVDRRVFNKRGRSFFLEEWCLRALSRIANLQQYPRDASGHKVRQRPHDHRLHAHARQV